MSLAIETKSLRKVYGATTAPDDVSSRLERAKIHAIVGENGAGKSTLIKVIAGLIGAGTYDGSLEINGNLTQFKTIKDAEALGVFLVPQEITVPSDLSVADFLLLNREPARFGIISRAKQLEFTSRWLTRLGLSQSPLDRLGDFSPDQQQLVCIARAMSQEASILILDEPTASLTFKEVASLLNRLKQLASEGVTILYMSHRMAEIEELSDTVTILRDGRLSLSLDRSSAEIRASAIVKAMSGKASDQIFPLREPLAASRQIVEVKGWSVASAIANRPPIVENIEFALRAGEIVGLFGLLGSGASELSASLFGAGKQKGIGSITIDGVRADVRTPRSALRAGIAYLPPERKHEGLAVSMSTSANATLVALDRFTRMGIIDRQSELLTTMEFIKSLSVKVRSIDDPISGLSGGNQQKVALGRSLMGNVRFLIANEPTRGVDIQARALIYRMLDDIARKGVAILLVSTDLSEIMGLSDRVLAFRQGGIVGEWPKGRATEEEVMLCASDTIRKKVS